MPSTVLWSVAATKKAPRRSSARLAGEPPECASTGAMPATSPGAYRNGRGKCNQPEVGSEVDRRKVPSACRKAVTRRRNPLRQQQSDDAPPAAAMRSGLGQQLPELDGSRPAPSANRRASSF